MMGKYSNTALDAFIKSQRDRTIAYLQRNFSVSKVECEDIFQDSFIILYQNAQEGMLDNLTSSVSTYFMAICRNKTMELLRTKDKYIHSLYVDIAGYQLLVVNTIEKWNGFSLEA